MCILAHPCWNPSVALEKLLLHPEPHFSNVKSGEMKVVLSKVPAALRSVWEAFWFVISHTYLALGSGLTEWPVQQPQALEESNHLCFISRFTNIQGWHSPKPENSLKWKLEREKKEKESRDSWGWGRALIAPCVDAAHNLKQALRFVTVPRSDPWHIRAQPLKNNNKKRCAFLSLSSPMGYFCTPLEVVLLGRLHPAKAFFVLPSLGIIDLEGEANLHVNKSQR